VRLPASALVARLAPTAGRVARPRLHSLCRRGGLIPAAGASGAARNRRTRRRLAALVLLVPLLTALAAGSGTAWASAPRHRFVYEVTATIPIGGESAVAVDQATNTVYVVCGLGNSVDVINGATNSLTAIIVMPGAGALAVDPATDKIYVTQYRSVSVIDGATNKVTATLPLPGLPGGVTDIAVNPATNMIYVSGSNGTTGAVSVINGATNTTTATISLSAGSYAVGLAADPGTNTVAVATQYWPGGGVALINGNTFTVTSVDLLEPQYAVGIDVSTGIYYSEGIGDLNAVNAHTSAAGQFATFPCPLTMQCGAAQNELGVDSALHVIYASFEQGGNGVVLVYEAVTGRTGAVPVPGAGPLAVNAVTDTAYVISGGNNTVTVISRVWI
jgi:YVTN family beta-propeller protein